MEMEMDGHELDLDLDTDLILPDVKESGAFLDSTNMNILLVFLLAILCEVVHYFSWRLKIYYENARDGKDERGDITSTSRSERTGKDSTPRSPTFKRGFLVSDRTRPSSRSQACATSKATSTAEIPNKDESSPSSHRSDLGDAASSGAQLKTKTDLPAFKRGFLQSENGRSVVKSHCSGSLETQGESSKDAVSLADEELGTEVGRRLVIQAMDTPSNNGSNEENSYMTADWSRPFTTIRRSDKEITFKELADCNIGTPEQTMDQKPDVVPCIGKSPHEVLEFLQSCNDAAQYEPWKVRKTGNGFSFHRSKKGESKLEEKDNEDAEPEKVTNPQDSTAALADLDSVQKINQANRRNHYSTGGNGQDAWLRMRLPRLDKRARMRLCSPRSGGSAYGSSEREALEMYNDLMIKTADTGITVPDISGPEAFTERISRVRKRIEQEHKEAHDRFKMAKRLASLSNDIDQNLRLLTPAEEAIRAVHVSVESYKSVQRCWDLAIKRIRNAIDETEALKEFNSIEQAEGPVLQGETPRIGLFEPYPKDTLPRRMTSVSDVLWESEKLYDEAHAACARGEFCTANGYLLLRALDEEREQIQADYPSRLRIVRAKAYKLVCNLITKAGVHADCEIHRQFMIRSKRMFLIPGRPEVPNGRACLAKIVPDIAPTLGIVSSNNQDGKLQSEASHISCRSQEPLVVDTDDGPLKIDIPCLQGPPAFGEEDDDLIGICISCLERPALFIAKICGHLVYCRTCQRKAIAKQLDESSSSRSTTVRRRAHTLSNKQLDRTRVGCPICRQESLLVARDQFEGKIYEL